MYGVSYNTRDGEVKIHQGSCRHTNNQSQNGPVKWENYSTLEDATRAANRHSSRNNNWRYPMCCRRNASSYIYQCIKCDSLTLGKRFVKKKILGWSAFFTFGLGLICALAPQILHFYDIFEFDFITRGTLLFWVGIIVVPLVYYSHPKKCSNCKVKDFA